MAYTKTWDESQPDGSENANTIDTEIQDVKFSMRERLEDLFPRWSDDSEDPKTFDRARVKLSGNQSITTATFTALSWGTEDYDTNATGFWTGGAPTRLTIPAAGHYIIHGHVEFAFHATGERMITTYVNGSIVSTVSRDAGSASYTGLEITYINTFAANDYIEHFVYQSSGGNLLALANVSYATAIKLA